MVGCNEDAWRTTSKIWFEAAIKNNKYGAAFTGSRQLGNGKTAPQSGMNEAGLAFSRLGAYHPNKGVIPNRLKITSEYDYLTEALHTCGIIEEVKQFIERYDHSVFIDDVFIYIDSTGKYLIVEPYKLIEGNRPNYVLANFCPSLTSNTGARKMERYRNGEDFLMSHSIEPSLAFCTAMSDTMHVCRNRNGDGTLLTSIWNTKERLVNLYFYHQYDTTIQFNIKEELAKGEHSIDIPSLFPKSLEFERLANYKTPFNTSAIRVSLALLGAILTLFALLLGFYQLLRKKSYLFVPISGTNLLLTGYLFVLATNSYIFYFDAPFKHYSSSLISASSYMPFVLLLAIFPITYYTAKRYHSFLWWVKGVFLCNLLIYLVLLFCFSYWGLFQVWT